MPVANREVLGSPISGLALVVRSLTPRRRKQLVASIGLMLIAALCEVATIGAVVPLLTFLSTPNQPEASGWVGRLAGSLGGSVSANIGLTLTVLFSVTAITSGLTRVGLVYATARLNAAIGSELATEMFRRTLYQPYLVHVARNSSEAIGALQKLDVVVHVLFGTLNVLSSMVMGFFLTCALILIDPYIAAAVLFGLGGIYAVIALLCRAELARNDAIINNAYTTRVRCTQEALGGIRDILLGHTHDVFINQFSASDRGLREAYARNSFIAPAPRYLIEAVAMMVIAGLGYWLTSRGGSLANALPVLGALALGSQRLMPLIQQIYNGVIVLRGHHQLIWDVVDLLQQRMPKGGQHTKNPLPFEKEIRFKGVSFAYQPQQPPAASNLHFTIHRGERVGIIGKTGSGKTTLTDLIMGLLEPTEGSILVDGRPLIDGDRMAWQRNIAHVPQAIFLTDASFAENIAFGVPEDERDLNRVRNAARNAQLADFIESQPAGYETIVGERGIRLSGGQRQRIAIARALYSGAPVLVFDEATSALDDDTEAAVMDSVRALDRNLTIVMVAHRLGTLRECDTIICLEHGQLRELGSYDELIGSRYGRVKVPEQVEAEEGNAAPPPQRS